MPRRKKNSHEQRSSHSINKEKPQQRYAANARERARMRVLSRAFCRLKTTLPWVPADTKLSKLDTLRLAASYIAHLKGILRDETLDCSESSLHPAMSLVRTWPFGFNRPLGGSQQGGSVQGSDEEDLLEEEEDTDLMDGESVSSCTWEEVKETKECVHLEKKKNRGRTRGKRNNSPSPSSQVRKKKTTSSPFKQSQSVGGPLSQSQHHYHHHHGQEENFQNESNNNVVFHQHHHLLAQDKLESEAMMTVTNLENAPPPPPPFLHNDLVGIGGNNESFVNEMNSGDFSQHQSHHQHHNQQQHHNQYEIHSHHHIAPTSNPFAYSGNDLISIG